jgi:pyridoxamine 5'-phosphate oxidase
MSLSDLRRDYTLAGLTEADLDPDPIAQFRAWFDEAQVARGAEPNAMSVATVDVEGRPSVRTVLLKGLDERGFVFFTNYGSAKGRALTENPRAELLFYWAELERQVRIAGRVEQTSRAETEAYFRSRPIGNQIGALVSPQSQVIPNRDVLEQRYIELERQYESGDVPLPDHWGGYRVVPETIEFWQGRKSRLHDRLRYRREGSDAWLVERLAP